MRVGVTILAAWLGFAGPGEGFVPQLDRNTRGTVVSIRWRSTYARVGVDFWVDASSFPFPADDVTRAVDESFSTWEDVETSFVGFRNRGTGQFSAVATDNRNIVRYDRTGTDLNSPRGTGVIAFTRINWNDQGEVTDADIVFNGRDFQFSLAAGASGGRVDLQAVMTHEVGHFLGLDHAPLEGDVTIRPTMYPYYFGGERTLEPDDIAGVSYLYPASASLNSGTISGFVTHRDGRGAFGVHVVAYRATGGQFVVSALSGATGSSRGPGGNGRYTIPGLPPGDYVVAIEPLLGSVTMSNLGGIYRTEVDTDFPEEFFDNASVADVARVIDVSAGRNVSGIDFVLGTAVPGFPWVEGPVFPANTPDTDGPYGVTASISDEDGIASAVLVYSVNGGPVQTVPMVRGASDRYFGDLPGLPAGSVVEYRLLARDTEGNETTFPAKDHPPVRLEVLSLSGEPLLYIAQRRSRAVSVFDSGLEREVARIAVGETPLSLMLSMDERYLFVANSGEQSDGTDNLLSVIDTRTHRTAANIRLASAPLDMAMSPDGSRLFVTNSQGQSVSVVDVQSLREIRRLPVTTTRDGPFGIASSPDGSRIFVTDIDAAQVIAVDTRTGATVARISVVESPRSLAADPDAMRLYVSGFDGDVSVIDIDSNRVINTIDTGQAGVFRIALSPDGSRLYGTDRAGANLLVMDLGSGRVTDVVPASGGRETRGLAVSEDGRTVYVTNQDSNDLLMFDAQTLSIKEAYKLGDGPRGIAVRPRPLASSVQLTDASDADFDQSGRVDFGDFLLFARAFGTAAGSSSFDARFDLNRDDRVSFADFLLFAGAFGRSVGSDGAVVN